MSLREFEKGRCCVRHAQGDLVVRKDRRSGWVRLVGVAVGAALLTGREALIWGEEVALFSAVLWTVLIVWFAGNLYRAGIILTAHEIVVKGLVLRRRRPRAQVARVVRATVDPPAWSRRSSADTFFVLDAHGNVLVRASDSVFRTEDLERLVDALGVPCSDADHPVRAKELHRTHPGLVSWAERHPLLLAFPIVIVLAAVVAAMVIITGLGTG
jgi:hypothetical protein